jgi:tRNA (guanosine-2'-O-)-methyltransferase
VFSLSKNVDLFNGKFAVDYKDVLTHVFPLLTEERQRKITQVVDGRCFNISVVLESIYDRGNTSAVMRSAEGLGFSNFHVIETFEKFKEANRVTQGADKWLEVKKWKSTKECVQELKKNKVRICVTSLEASKPLQEIDFSTPLALVLGNEKDGVSKEMLEAADERVILPMPGFVQSFNISIAGALCLYHIWYDRKQKLGSNADLTAEQKEILRAYYAMRTMDSAESILKNKLSLGL